jgi:hypothetical protein
MTTREDPVYSGLVVVEGPAEPEDEVTAMLAEKGLALLKEARHTTAAGSILRRKVVMSWSERVGTEMAPSAG